MPSISRRTALKGGIAAAAARWPTLAYPFQIHGQQPLDESRNESSLVLDLSGEWVFVRDDERRGIDQAWYSGVLPAGPGPRTISLPGTMDEAQAGYANPASPDLSGLFRENIYAGPAWYQREIVIPDSWQGKALTVFLERVHWVTHAWLDGRELGTQESLISPHLYDLGTDVTPGKHLLTLCVDNTIVYDLGRFVSVYFEGTQTNWNGIIGRLEIVARPTVSIHSLRVFPDVDRKAVSVELTLRNLTKREVSGHVRFEIRDFAGKEDGSGFVPFSISNEENTLFTDVAIRSKVKMWDEFVPHLYTIVAQIDGREGDRQAATFGMRKLGVKGTQFTLNDRPLMLRGTLECGIFPLTGYPPTDVESWRRIYQIEKSYGLNFIRFHSWAPPQAAFLAADLEGIFIQAEAPQANVPTGKDLARDQFIERELLRIVDTYGNHPSFALMTIGNEFGGNLDVITRWVDLLIKADSRHLYSSASSNAMKSENRQFTEDRQMRGVHGPGTDYDYDEIMAKENRPFIGHEIGQWTFYPNLDEERKYSGVLKASNFEIVRQDLRTKGMLDQAPLFLEATGKLAILLYKDEIETIRRTRGYAGFSLLDLHDYPGQGTALIGLLDAFWDLKGLIEPATHKGYAGATAPLLRLHKRTYTQNERLAASVDLSHFGPLDLPNAEARWTVTHENGACMASGTLPVRSVKTGELSQLGSFSIGFAEVQEAAKLTINVSLTGTDVSNEWDIWVYRNQANWNWNSRDVLVLDSWGDAAKAALADGKEVVLFPRSLRPANTLKGSFKSVFWSPIWFNRDPSTMGLLVNPDHPLFDEFPTDIYSNWQWYSLIEGSQSIILDSCPSTYRPLVQVIDNLARNHRLGTVFEATVGNGRLMVCTLNLNREAPEKQTPEQRSFMASISAYVSSPLFAPKQQLDARTLDGILNPI
jgi:hypothetical protein